MITIDELNRDWRTFEYAVVDLEGTGAQHRDKEGVVDIAVVLIRNGSVGTEIYRRLLDPEIEIPLFVSRIHGIYDKDVKGRPVFTDIIQELEELIFSRFLVAHNAAVERRVLSLKMPDYKPGITFDTLKMARALYGASERHGLDEVVQRLRLDERLSSVRGLSARHGASYDAMATALAFVSMAQENFPGGCSVRELVKMCALDSDSHPVTDQKAAADQQRSFGW